MASAHSPYAPTNIFHPEPVGFCDRCGFLYPLARLVDQRQWAGPTTVGLGIRVCTRTCLDELQENGFRTIVIGPDPVPLRDARPGTMFGNQKPQAPQFILEDVVINAPETTLMSATYTLNSVAATPVIPVSANMLRTSVLPPAILCGISTGAVLTYSVEVTGDNLVSPTYSPATGNWVPIDPTMTGLTAAANATLSACVTGIRARVTAYTSGILTFQFIWGSSS